ncbi:amidohydrolase [Acidobacteria bacterium AH-259-L09]|nr:amidohydrolase [Acidobacteria bacterium AH-259-L09]
MRLIAVLLSIIALSTHLTYGQAYQKLEKLKQEGTTAVEEMKDFTQQMVDMIFSFGELGFQEFETSRYVVDILKKNGFQVEEGISGIPTAWIAKWGSGKPVISLGSDIDGIPKASQKPGVAYHDPIIEGAPGHGEGHNSGQAVNVTAALVVKSIMEREGISGTLMLWAGVAEEQLASKAYFVRDGYFKSVDIVLFTHVGDNFDVSYGPGRGSGLVSVEYTFRGDSAHSAGAPWRGRSALDAVELMNQAWNYRREHLRLQQRSHYVITKGGDQPNVVPSLASVWYFFREIDYPHIKELFETGNTIAKAAAAMTNTEVEWRILGSAWPRHFNKVVAETMYDNIKEVGLPQWSKADQTLAKAVQREVGGEEKGLNAELPEGPEGPQEHNYGGGSDDIGDISWNVPTVTLRYPANIPGLPGHHWSNAVAMATPISHKGATAGAMVLAMTTLDLFLRPELVEQAWDYFHNVQGKETKYLPLISAGDKPAVHLNREIMEKYGPQMKKFYFDPSKYKTYLEQLGIDYPTTKNIRSASRR